jgi:hypothetical protein
LDRADRACQVLAARDDELKNRGAQDILIAVVDGLKGFPEAINAVFPQTVIQTCIGYLIRHSMDFAAWNDRKNVAQALRVNGPRNLLTLGRAIFPTWRVGDQPFS